MRTRLIELGAKKLLIVDFSGLDNARDALAAIAESRAFVDRQPRDGQLLTITKVNDALFDTQVVEALKELATHNRPWVRAGAVVGLSPVQQVIFRLVNTFTGRRLSAFNTEDEARAWLLRQ